MKQTGLFGTGAVLLIGLALLVTVGMFVARSRRQSAM
jgi:LPXTG-motif cell wall-anchored protein